VIAVAVGDLVQDLVQLGQVFGDQVSLGHLGEA
jgi:hypothetical protein